ncbi:MAG: hypothetical protein M3384_10700, partial [Acidobacteriota bacterium]|nr:hypothetical protein [Acidobacteriota bacterium]
TQPIAAIEANDIFYWRLMFPVTVKLKKPLPQRTSFKTHLLLPAFFSSLRIPLMNGITLYTLEEIKRRIRTKKFSVFLPGITG